MTAPDSTLHCWSDLPLEKVTAMVSRKVVAGERQTLIQAYLKRGTHVPLHAHDAEQMLYVLKGALRCRVATRDVTVRDGEVLHVPQGVPHQAEALEDTFELVVLARTTPAPNGSGRSDRGRSRRGAARSAGGGGSSSSARNGT